MPCRRADGKPDCLTATDKRPMMTAMSWLQKTANGLTLSVRVVPRADRNAIQGVLGDALKIRLQAPPVDSKANEALVDFLADTLDVPRRNIALLSGATHRAKRVLVTGIDETALRAALRV